MQHAWIWPTRRADTPTWNVRLGRVIHWTGITFSVLSVLFGAWETASSVSNHIQSRDDAEAYDREHKDDTQFQVVMPTGRKYIVFASSHTSQAGLMAIINDYIKNSPLEEFASVEAPPAEIHDGGLRPNVSEPDYGSAIIGIFLAAIFALLSRCARYLLANE